VRNSIFVQEMISRECYATLTCLTMDISMSAGSMWTDTLPLLIAPRTPMSAPHALLGHLRPGLKHLPIVPSWCRAAEGLGLKGSGLKGLIPSASTAARGIQIKRGREPACKAAG